MLFATEEMVCKMFVFGETGPTLWTPYVFGGERFILFFIVAVFSPSTVNYTAVVKNKKSIHFNKNFSRLL